MTERTRQELYAQLRSKTREEFILDDMVRLGFWTEGRSPNAPDVLIRERAKVENELKALRTEVSRLGDVKRLAREARKRRMAEARRKRIETKARRLRLRAERAQAWAERKAREVVYLGEGVSGGLSKLHNDAARLAKNGLPNVASAREIADAMGIDVGRLRFLAFSRKVSRTSHYARFTVPKKTGGVRELAAPMPWLKAAQRWILERILSRVPIQPDAHGFVPGRSIVTNAKPHVGAGVVINMDLEDFFPSITYRRVRGLFVGLGYCEAAATVFALLCTEPEVETVELDGLRWFVAVGPRRLPQGAPSSPAITNLICRVLDVRLGMLATTLGFTYTRYADDLTFSHEDVGEAGIGRILRKTREIVEEEGFQVHPKKTRVQRAHQHQEVTGLVVNQRVGVPRAKLKRFRAVLHQIERSGPEGKHWNDASGERLFDALQGFAEFVAMVQPERGEPLRQRVFALRGRYDVRFRGRPAPAPRPSGPATQAAAAAAPKATAPRPAPPTAPPAAVESPKVQDAPATQDDADTGGASDDEAQWWKLF